MNKKKYERLLRERSERDATARVDSKDRQERIKVLWNLEKRQFTSGTNRAELERKLKSQKIKELLESLGEATSQNDFAELIELVGLQDREIDYLMRFRRDWERIEAHYPTELENLSFWSSFEELKPHIAKRLAKRKPKQTYENKRRFRASSVSGEIENAFANLTNLSSQNFGLAAYQQMLGIYTSTAIDDILAEGRVSMSRLQQLFGLNRNRFPKNLPSLKKGRESLYDYRAVTKIMDTLLSENVPSPRRTRRGRPGRRWLSDSAIRTRVLTGIGDRLKVVAAPRHIAVAFLRVIRRHLPDSAKK